MCKAFCEFRSLAGRDRVHFLKEKVIKSQLMCNKVFCCVCYEAACFKCPLTREHFGQPEALLIAEGFY